MSKSATLRLSGTVCTCMAYISFFKSAMNYLQLFNDLSTALITKIQIPPITSGLEGTLSFIKMQCVLRKPH